MAQSSACPRCLGLNTCECLPWEQSLLHCLSCQKALVRTRPHEYRYVDGAPFCRRCFATAVGLASLATEVPELAELARLFDRL